VVPKSIIKMNVGAALQTLNDNHFRGSAIRDKNGAPLRGNAYYTWRGEGVGGFYGWIQIGVGGGKEGWPGCACIYMYILWLVVFGVVIAFPQSGDFPFRIGQFGNIYTWSQGAAVAG
jgi:hypothetical protein